MGGAAAGALGSFAGTLFAGGTIGEAALAAVDGAFLGGSAGFLAGLCGGCAAGAFVGAGFGMLASGYSGAKIVNDTIGSPDPEGCE